MSRILLWPTPRRRFGVNAFVVIVHGDGQSLLGTVLADNVGIEVGLDLSRLGQGAAVELGFLAVLLLEDLVAQHHALVADVDRGAGNQLLDLVVPLATEGAGHLVARLLSMCR